MKSTVFPHAVVNRKLRKYLTFLAPLTDQWKLFAGCRGSNAATYTGGVVTGAGAVYYAESPTTGLLEAKTSGLPVFTRNGFQALGAISNVLTYSNTFDNVAWISAPSSTNTANVTGPDGVANSAYTITDSSATEVQGIAQTVAIANDATSWTCGGWILKTVGATNFPAYQMFLSGGTAINMATCFNTNTGAFTTRTGYTAPSVTSAVSVGIWWKVGVTVANNNSGNTSLKCFFYPAVNADGSATWAGAAQGSTVIYGASLWNGAFAYPGHLQTQAVAASRTADLGSWPVAGNIGNPFTAAVTQTPGVLASSATANEIGFSSNDASNLNGFRMGASAIANFPTFATITDATQSSFTGTTGAFVVGTPKRLALAAALNDVEGFADGVSMGTDTSAAVPTHTTLYAGRTGASNVIAYGSVKGAMVFGVRLNAVDVARLR